MATRGFNLLLAELKACVPPPPPIDRGPWVGLN